MTDGPPSGARAALRAYLALVGKDLRIEARSPAILYTMLLFAALLVVVFAFAFYIVDDRVRGYAPGIVWVAVLFSATLGTGRVFDREERDGCLDGLLLVTPSSRTIYLAKATVALLFSGLMAALVVPLVVLFFNLRVPHPGWLVAAMALGLFGFCAVGTFFGGLMARLPARQALVPLIVFPLVVPLFIAGVKATGLNFRGEALLHVRSWTGLMLAFDLIFGSGSAWLFPLLLRDR